MIQIQTLKRDNLLVDFLIKHKGKGNCVSSNEICVFLNERGFTTKVDNIHKIIRKLIIERSLPICHINSKGYFWAENQAEIQLAIDDLQGRISRIQLRIETLKNFIVE